MNIERKPFGKTRDDKDAWLYLLHNDHGHYVELTDFGATIVGVYVPDRDGSLANVNLGFDSIDGYLQRHPYFGSTVGRVCNRIANGRFCIEGKTYQLARNLGDHHLHGGNVGFDAYLWDCEPLDLGDAVGLRMSLHSPDGDEGYPGDLDVSVTFSWNNDNELCYEFSASCNMPTHVNLTNHAYWNLGGAGSGKIYDHLTMIDADQYLEVDADLIPTGQLADVTDTALDFLRPRRIGERIDQLPATNGYDHCYALNGEPGVMRFACRTIDPTSGRVMELETTQPGMQLYAGNHLSGGSDAAGFGKHEAFCFETQHFPDAANQPLFQSTRLDPGQRMSERTLHRFLVDR